MDTRTSPHRLRIERVQDALKARNLAALLVPSSDPHLSEYLPERWQGRVGLSDFTGSMGTLAVTTDRAALFADSRYWGQAEAELAGSGIELVKIPTGAATHHIEWLIAHTPAGGAVAVDGQVLGLAAAEQLRAALEQAGRALRTDIDLLADVWVDAADGGAGHRALCRTLVAADEGAIDCSLRSLLIGAFAAEPSRRRSYWPTPSAGRTCPEGSRRA